MKFASFTLSPDDQRPASRRVEEKKGWWVRFGSHLFVCSASSKWREVSAQFEAAARDPHQTEGEVRRADMHLVTQKGRTFQLENPDVRVLLDKGRYLVVDLPKEKAKRLAGRRDPCFRIEPLARNSVVFEVLPRRAAPRAAEAQIAEMVEALDPAIFERSLAHLVSLPTRHSTSAHFAEVAEWARQQFVQWGYAASLEPVSVGGSQSCNVVARRDGTGGDGRGAVLIVAHLDSVNQPGGASADAPGADDNASGSAGALALAAAAAGRSFRHDLVFVLFGGEEQGLHGSLQYVEALTATERNRIRAVLNMDMIGSVNVAPRAVLLEGADLSQAIIDGLALAASQFTDLAVQSSLNPFASDHVPFIDADIPAVLTIEGADGANDAIHTINDTLDRVNVDFAMEILRMNAARLAAEAGVVVEMADCGCGEAATAQPELSAALNLLSGHYQALFAQYARLQRDVGMQAQDLVNWQSARTAHGSLMAQAGLAPEDPES